MPTTMQKSPRIVPGAEARGSAEKRGNDKCKTQQLAPYLGNKMNATGRVNRGNCADVLVAPIMARPYGCNKKN